MMTNGMTIARLNFSHGDHEYHRGTIENIRKAIEQFGNEIGVPELKIPIALDTKGPEIRTGMVGGGVRKQMLSFVEPLYMNTVSF